MLLVSALLAAGGTLFTNGRIVVDPADPARTVASLWVVDGRVAAIGPEAPQVGALPRGAAVVDLQGAWALPGWHDAHGHVVGLGSALDGVDLGSAASFDEAIELLARRAAELPPGAWVQGRGWDQTRWPGGEFPHHRALSERVPAHPVFARRVDGHAALVNERALERAGLAGVLDPPPEVEGGRVLLDAEGRATGVLVDAATGLVSALVPPPSPADLRRRILRAQERLLSVGLCCVHEMGLAPAEIEAFEALDAAGELVLRVLGYAWANDGLVPPASLPPSERPAGLGAGRFRLVGVKLMLDGALGSRGAALREDYADEPGRNGLLLIPPERFGAVLARLVELDLQPATHAIGDRANHIALDAYAEAERRDPAFARLRPRVEHAQVLAPGDGRRFRDLGVVASMQPTHATSDMRWALDRLGPDRLAGAYAWRSLLEAGAPLAFGSDFPVEDPAPRLGLYAARTRQDAAGHPPGGWRPAERLGSGEALAAFTRGAAWAGRVDGELGCLAPGYDADLTVVDTDPVADGTTWMSARVLATFVRGELAYRAEDFAAAPVEAGADDR